MADTPREILIAWASSGGFAAVHNAGATDAQIVDDLLKWLREHGLSIVSAESVQRLNSEQLGYERDRSTRIMAREKPHG